MFFDIEVQRDDAKRYSTTKDANNIINSIAYYDTVHKQYTTLILDPAVSKIKLDKKEVGNVFICPDEEQLLMLFVKIWSDVAPTIVCGWNSDNFDIPYLIAFFFQFPINFKAPFIEFSNSNHNHSFG